MRLNGYWCLLFALSSSAAELCAGVPKCQQEMGSQPRKELRVRAGGSSESPDTNLSGYSLRGLNGQPLSDAVRTGSLSFLTGLPEKTSRALVAPLRRRIRVQVSCHC